jgi:hypothetical protein
MTYKVNIEEQQNYIRVEVSGKRIPGKETDDAIRVWASVAETCRKKNITRILAINNIPGRLPALAAYSLAESPEEFGWSRHFKLTVVDVNEDSRKDNLFTETVAVNRGYNVKIFDNENDAKEWLLQS